MNRCVFGHSLSGRWKIDAKKAKISHPVSKRPILQFVSIKRKDCGEWAIPGVGGFYISLSNRNEFTAKTCELGFECFGVRGHGPVTSLLIGVGVIVLQGMVDAGEQVSLTLQREFSEEALNSLTVPAPERAKINERIGKLFKSAGFQVRRRRPLTSSLPHFSLQVLL